jgi:multiple sugar transport system permease protein
MEKIEKRKHKKHIPLNWWGWIFIIPFFVIFIWLQAVPLGQTFYYGFFTYYKNGSSWVGPTYCGWSNFYSADPDYVSLFGPGGSPEIGYRKIFLFNKLIGKWYIPDVIYYLFNTMVIWIIGFVPQMIVSLALAIWFTDIRLKLKFKPFWKTVMYMPNLVMAAAFGLLFQLLFTSTGPVVQILTSMGILNGEFSFLSNEMWTRLIIAFINFLMWFGNTTLLLMSGVMGIDQSIFESAEVDGAGATRTFWSVTMPLLKPIFIYVLITSLIGGIQLYDVSYIFTKGGGGVNLTSYTIMNYLFDLINNNNYGLGGALSVFMFLITAVLSMSLYFYTNRNNDPEKDASHERNKRFRQYRECADTQSEKQRFEQLKVASKGAK